jgi:type IV secretory pathway VirB10-like protein
MSRRQNSLLVSPHPVEKKSKQPSPSPVEDNDVVLANEQGGSDEDETHDTVFKTKCKTKEETTTTEEGYSTIMMIVFAIILVVLVCLIVWMVVSTNETKKNEEEIKDKLIKPHIMPPNPFQIPQHMQPMHHLQMQQMHHMQMMQNQARLNPKVVQNEKVQVEVVEEPKKENLTAETPPKVKEQEDEEITSDYLKELSKKAEDIIKDGKPLDNKLTNKNTAEWNKEDKAADEKMKRTMEAESEELPLSDY